MLVDKPQADLTSFPLTAKSKRSELFRTKDFFENLACCLYASDEAC